MPNLNIEIKIDLSDSLKDFLSNLFKDHDLYTNGIEPLSQEDIETLSQEDCIEQMNEQLKIESEPEITQEILAQLAGRVLEAIGDTDKGSNKLFEIFHKYGANCLPDLNNVHYKSVYKDFIEVLNAQQTSAV